MSEQDQTTESADADISGRQRWIEFASVLLLALAAVAIAWCGYEAARWGGEQATDTATASSLRLESSRANATGGQLAQIDIAMFTQAVNAFAVGDDKLLAFYEDRLRDEFRPAYEEWRALMPGTNPDAPLSPFELDSYTVAELVKADELDAAAELKSADSREARKNANQYTIVAVLLTAVLFFAGISTRFASNRPKYVLLVLATVIFIAVTVILGVSPRSVSL
jgi:hypothetical protein